MKYLKGSILLIFAAFFFLSNNMVIEEAGEDKCGFGYIGTGLRIIVNTMSAYNRDPKRRSSINTNLEKFLNSKNNQNLINVTFHEVVEVIKFFDSTLLQKDLLRALNIIYEFLQSSITKARRLLLNLVKDRNITMTEALHQFIQHRNDSNSEFEGAYQNLKQIFREYNETQVNIFMAKTQPKHQHLMKCLLKSLKQILFRVSWILYYLKKEERKAKKNK